MRTAATIRTTCPRDCYDACGVLVKTSTDGTINVVGDPDHDVSRGALCGKCSIAYNGIWRDPSVRLTRPLQRVGPKGSGQFQPVSWDQALADIGHRLNTIRNRDGGSAILQTHYTGTCSLIAGSFPLRFFNRIGATEVDPDTVCNKAGHVALQLMYGESTRGFDPRTIDGAQCVMIWGANPSASAPHVHQYWLGEARAPKIVVDPIRHETAAAADIHLQPYPGTDGALAFAMLHVISAAGRIDPTFLAAHTLGWEEIECQLTACTPAWGEATTGVAARLIEDAALLYATGPSLLWMGQGFQRQSFGGNAMRAVGLLPAATGNIGRYGAGFLLSQWLGHAGRRCGLSDGRAPQTGVGAIDQPHGSGKPARIRPRPKRSSPGTTTLPSRAPSSDACAKRSSAKTCCKSRSTCSRPTPPSMPTTCFPPRVSLSSTTWSCPISTPASRRKRRPSRRSVRRCPTRKFSGVWRRPWN